mgnify:CR=1 FL=1
MIEYAYRELSEYHRVRGTFLLPPVLNEFRREYPAIHVEIVEANSMDLENMLKNGTIDIALIILPAKTLKHNIQVLMRDEICIIAGSSHPVLKFAQPSPPSSKSRIPKYINLKDAIEFEFLLSDYDTILGRESRRIFREHDLIPKVHNEKLSAFMAASMGAAGLGLAFTYYCARNYYSQAEFLSLESGR